MFVISESRLILISDSMCSCHVHSPWSLHFISRRMTNPQRAQHHSNRPTTTVETYDRNKSRQQQWIKRREQSANNSICFEVSLLPIRQYRIIPDRFEYQLSLSWHTGLIHTTNNGRNIKFGISRENTMQIIAFIQPFVWPSMNNPNPKRLPHRISATKTTSVSVLMRKATNRFETESLSGRRIRFFNRKSF